MFIWCKTLSLIGSLRAEERYFVFVCRMKKAAKDHTGSYEPASCLKLMKTDKVENQWILHGHSPQYRAIEVQWNVNLIPVLKKKWHKQIVISEEKKIAFLSQCYKTTAFQGYLNNHWGGRKKMKPESLWVIHTSSLHPSSLNSDVIRRDLRWHRGKRRPSHCLNNFTPAGVERLFYLMLLCYKVVTTQYQK